jgi:predicted short-subunit dehydrogenase-like oxidoreductase (DUF2520 family)
MTKISIIGPGRVGGAFAIALSGRGYVVDSIAVRQPEKGRDIAERLGRDVAVVAPDHLDELGGEIILITTRDDQIKGVASQLSSVRLSEGTKVLHTSGSRTSEILYELRTSGVEIGSIHPLVSISDPVLGASRFEGAYFCVEGDAGAVSAAKEIAASLGGRPFEIPTGKKPLYHAAAVMACGHLVALISESVEILSICGPAAEESKSILLPLIGSTLQNLRDQSFADALTGPFARDDIETFRSHVAAFEGEISDEIVSAYLLLGMRSLEIARRNKGDTGGSDEFIELVRGLLERDPS